MFYASLLHAKKRSGGFPWLDVAKQYVLTAA